MIWDRLGKLVTKIGIAALALGALATAGKTQNIYQGKFTLPAETHWGGAPLPAGDYTFTVASANRPIILEGGIVPILMLAHFWVPTANSLNLLRSETGGRRKLL